MPTAFEFGPDFVIVSAGFDAADGDPIGDCQVTPYGFAQMTHQLMSLAGGRVLLVLEGGYNVPVIADCAEACLRTLVGDPIAYEQEQAAVSPSSVALQAMAATIRAQSPYWKSLYPRHHPVLETIFPCAVSLQGLCDAYWANVCQKEFRLIPLPIADGTLNSHFSNRIHISDNLLEHPSGIVVFAHEGGTMYSGNGDSNIIDLRNGILHQPFLGYLDEARNEDWAIVDIHTTTHKWRQKQNQTGASEDLTILNEMMLYLWDNFLALSDTLNVFFITSGLSAYSICNLMEKRITSQLVRGIVVLSPTLFLPVATAEKATWYAQNSLVIVPTRRPEGTAIPTNPSFGTCISSGSEEPLEINNTITRCQARVFSFIRERLNAS
jgi:histone deacetylase 6